MLQKNYNKKICSFDFFFFMYRVFTKILNSSSVFVYFHIDNKKIVSLAPNQHIRWFLKDHETKLCITGINYILKYIQIENVYFNITLILQFYCSQYYRFFWSSKSRLDEHYIVHLQFWMDVYFYLNSASPILLLEIKTFILHF